MNRPCVVILCVFFILTSLTSGQTGWEFKNNPVPSTIYSSYVIDGTVYYWCDYNLLFSTSDAGETFDVKQITMPEYYHYSEMFYSSLNFINSKIGFISAGSNGGYRTSDGGVTWQFQGGHPNEVVFGSETTGWRFDYSSSIYKTRDTGETWTRLDYYFSNGTFSHASAVDEYNLWVTLNYGPDGNRKSGLMASTDGGFAWVERTKGIDYGDSVKVHYFDFKMRNAQFGVGIVKIEDGTHLTTSIISTNDYGYNWKQMDLGYYLYARDIVFTNDSTAVIVGQKTVEPVTSFIQLKTTDRGVTWIEKEFELNYQYYWIYSLDYIEKSSTILLYLVNGVFKSDDGGETYQEVTNHETLRVTRLAKDKNPASPDKQTILAYRDYGDNEYLISTDSGINWERRSIPTAQGGYYEKLSVHNDVLFLTNQFGGLYFSTDSGDSWHNRKTYLWFNNPLMDIYDKDKYVFAYMGELITTLDGGESWQVSHFSRDFHFTQMEMVSSDFIIGIGLFYSPDYAGSAVYKTTDAGNSWAITPLKGNLENLKMLDETYGFLEANNFLYRTTDGGKNWLKSSDDRITSYDMKSSSFGMMNSSSKFYSTVDGGETWLALQLPYTYEYAQDMIITANGNYIAITNGNLLFYNSRGEFSDEPAVEPAVSDFPVLYQNYPNPFNPETAISFYVPENARVKISVYDVTGQLVSLLTDNDYSAGTHQVRFNGSELASGVYFYAIESFSNGKMNHSSYNKMMLLK